MIAPLVLYSIQTRKERRSHSTVTVREKKEKIKGVRPIKERKESVTVRARTGSVGLGKKVLLVSGYKKLRLFAF